jgi:transposase
MSAIVTIGIDLAKNVFAVHGANATGQPALVRPSVPRAKLLELIASLPPCLIGMEACSGAHHWAREFQRFGHTVRLMAPKFVIPYRRDHGHRTPEHDRQRARLQVRTPVVRLAGVGARAVQLGRQAAPGAHHQGG